MNWLIDITINLNVPMVLIYHACRIYNRTGGDLVGTAGVPLVHNLV